MKKPSNILAIIGKAGRKSPKQHGNNTGIKNLLKHFDTVAKVFAYKQELIDMGWLPKGISQEEFQNQVYANVYNLKSKVSEEGTVVPPKVIDRTAPKYDEDEPDVTKGLYQPKYAYTEEEEVGAADFYKREMLKAEKKIRKLQAEAFIGKEKVNRMAEAAAEVKPAIVKMNMVNSGKCSGKYHNVLPISDLHFGEVVQPNVAFGYNKYNPDIAIHRLEKLFEDNYRFATMYGCDDLHILLLGDLISGEIHDELRETNAYTAPKCVSVLNSVLTGIIIKYAKLYKRVKISCVVGNHSRTGKKLQSKNRAQDNYEHIIYSTIKDRCEAETTNVDVEFDDEAAVLITTIGNQKWMLEHGDRYKGSTAAAGAINTILRQIGNDLRRNHADVAIMGHWHTGAEGAVDAREDGKMTKVYVNPSIVGPDDFATTVLHAYYPAESNIFITDGNDIVAKVSIDLSTVQE